MTATLTIAHLSDTHLGYRAFAKEHSKWGVNYREVDVYFAFANALKAIEEAKPDLVLITGDLFDKKVPSIWSLRRAFRALRHLQETRGGKPLILLGGNHDTPRMRESSAVFPLFEEIAGIKAVYGQPEKVEIASLNTAVMCVPAAGAVQMLEENWLVEPDPSFAFNILAVHGVVQGVETADYTPFFMPMSRVLDERWNYIALGDYHDFKKLSANAVYAGATEFTTTNIWREHPVKGWVWVKIEGGKPVIIQHRAVKTRRVVNLPEVDASQYNSSDDVVENVLHQAASDSIKEALVRVRVVNLPYALRAKVQRAIREQLPQAFYVHVDFRTEVKATAQAAKTVDAAIATRSIEDRWRQYVEENYHDIPQNINIEEIIARGLEALNAVSEEVST